MDREELDALKITAKQSRDGSSESDDICGKAAVGIPAVVAPSTSFLTKFRPFLTADDHYGRVKARPYIMKRIRAPWHLSQAFTVNAVKLRLSVSWRQ